MLKRLSQFLFGTLRGRLVLSVAAVHAAMMALFVGDLTARQRALILNHQIETATALSQALAFSAAGWIAADDISGLQELVDAQRRHRDILFVMIVDEEGRILASSAPSNRGQYALDLPRDARQAMLSGTPDLVDVAVPAMVASHHVGWARVGLGQKSAAARLTAITRDGVLYALTAILIGSVVASFMGRRITRRLYAVQETINAIRRGIGSARSRLTGTDEASVMAREFDAMLDVLTERDAELRANAERYRLLIHRVQSAIVVHDRNGRVLDSNPLAREILDLSETQLLGKSLIDPEWRFLREDGSVLPSAEYPVSLTLSTRQHLRGYVMGINRPSKRDFVWVLVSTEPEYDAAGEIERVIVSFVDITARKLAERNLALMSLALDNVQEAAYLTDASGQFRYVNERACHVLGYTRAELLRLGVTDIDPCFPSERWSSHWNEIRERGSTTFESQHQTKEGRRFSVEVCANYFEFDGKAHNLALVRDISERKRAEVELHRLNRELRALSICHQVLVRTEDEQTLLNDVCRTMCEEANYRLVWVGYAENDDAKTVRPIAWAGVDAEYVANTRLSWSEDSERGKGPGGTTIRTGEVVYVQDFATDSRMAPWQTLAGERGYRSCVGLPLKDEQSKVFGVLLLYSTDTNVFTSDELRLLEELANDLAFGVMVLRARIERDRLERVNQARLRLFQHAVSHTLAEVLHATLDEVKSLSNSCIGFYHFLDAGQKTLLNENGEMHFDVADTGIWLDCVHARTAVVYNADASQSQRNVVSKNHASITREVGVPVLRHGDVVAVLGVGNKPQDYTQQDVELVSLFADLAWEIVEHKRTEEALADAQMVFRNLVEKSPDVIARYDRNCQRTYVNPTYLKETSLSRHALLATTPLEVSPLPTTSATILQDLLQSVLESGVSKAVDVPWPKSDGREHWYNIYAFPEIDREGCVTGVMTISRDITQRKQAEDELARSNERFALAAFAAHLGVWDWDIRRDQLVWDDGMYLLYGIRRTDSVSANDAWLLGVPSEDRRRCDEIWRLALSGERDYDTEFPVVWPNGSTHYLKAYGLVVRDEAGIPLRMTGVNFDITERTQAEMALRASEAKTRGILDNIGLGVALINPRLRIIELNHRMREWFPQADTTKDLQCFRLLPDMPRDTPCDNCPVLETFRDGLVHEASMQWACTARRRDFRIVSSPLFNADGETSAGIVMIEDITERLAMESQLRQAQKMEAVGRLAGGVAHDFNNMLCVILGQSALALEAGEPSDPFYSAMQEIQTAAQRSAELTRQLLGFARKQTASPKVLHLNQTVAEMVKMLQRLIGEDVKLDFIPGNVTQAINLDPSQLDQILTNLCINARDAIGGVGRIVIETASATIDDTYCADHPESITGTYNVLAVSDSGSGMDRETVNKIFEPFFTTKEYGKGTGLGLATVYGIVRQNAGFINVYSELGTGSVFRVYLPVFIHHGVSPDKRSSSVQLQKGTETVLLVEDEVQLLNLAKQFLERLGYQVLATDSPHAALRLAQEFHGTIHALVSDVVMPDMSGRELSDRLLLLRPNIKSLFVSGYTANVISHHGILDQGVCFLQKPYSIEALSRKLREALSRR